MEIRFSSDELARLESDPKYLGGWPASVVKAYRKRINFIRQAASERDLYSWKSLQVEKLKGARQGQQSMRLNDQWRLIFMIEGTSDSKVFVVIRLRIITDMEKPNAEAFSPGEYIRE